MRPNRELLRPTMEIDRGEAERVTVRVDYKSPIGSRQNELIQNNRRSLPNIVPHFADVWIQTFDHSLCDPR